MPTTRIVVPSGHMGTTPFEQDSFRRGVAEKPDYVIADSGSADIGPHPLGADRPPSAEIWQRHDLEQMLLAARELGVPMIVGSASDTGTDKSVDRYLRLLRGVADQHRLKPFRVAAIYAEQPVETVRGWLAAGRAIDGLDGRPPADAATLDRTSRIVAVMGPEPIMAALDGGADVVICGRSSDPAIFAAALLRDQHSKADSFFAGKALECASFCAEPFMQKETVLGRIGPDGVYVTAMHPKQRCTPTSVAAHTMYERRNPFREYVPGGYVDMSECRYEQVDEKTTRVTNYRFVEDAVYRVKLEGAGKVAERRIFIAGVRDPYTIRNFDQVLSLARAKVERLFGPIGSDYRLHYHVYGRDAIMGPMEPEPDTCPKEMGIVTDVICKDPQRCEDICHVAAKALFGARLPEVKGTAGTAAIFTDEVITLEAAYEWTLNHVIAVDSPHELFRTEFMTMGGEA